VLFFSEQRVVATHTGCVSSNNRLCANATQIYFRLLVLRLRDRDVGARLLAYIICNIPELDECERLGLLVTVARLDGSWRQPFARDKGASSCDNARFCGGLSNATLPPVSPFCTGVFEERSRRLARSEPRQSHWGIIHGDLVGSQSGMCGKGCVGNCTAVSWLLADMDSPWRSGARSLNWSRP
jgi:hypothetical protein